MTGYLAFPPGSPIQFIHHPNPPPNNAQKTQAALEEVHQRLLKEQAWQARCQLDQQRRQQRLAREQAEAHRSELEWVRLGGVLRDPQGHRDMPRTESYRAEIRLQDEEKRILDSWVDYEGRWRALSMLAPEDHPISWTDIPWPVLTAPKDVEDLRTEVIKEFIFSTLRVRSNTSTRKEKIRASLLRWHPDKVSTLLGRVVVDDQDRVQRGVNAVFISLRELQTAEKDHALARGP